MATAFNTHCTVQCTADDFKVKFATDDIESVGHCTVLEHDIMHRRAQCPGTETWAAVRCGDIMNRVYLYESKITRTAVSLGEYWHATNWSDSCLYYHSYSVPALRAFSYISNQARSTVIAVGVLHFDVTIGNKFSVWPKQYFCSCTYATVRVTLENRCWRGNSPVRAHVERHEILILYMILSWNLTTEVFAFFAKSSTQSFIIDSQVWSRLLPRVRSQCGQ